SLKDGFNHFTLRPEPLPLGEYVIQSRISPGDLKRQQTFTVIHREQSRVVLNSNGYLEHQGKPIFPLGIFNGTAKVVEMGKAGFTVQHAYNAANAEPGERPPDEEARQFIDEAQHNGMMALF